MSERYFTPEDLTEFPGIVEPEALALSFGRYLAEYRKERTGLYLPCDISATPPDIYTGGVRLPHLVAFQKDDTIRDVAMWETLSHPRAEGWLGSELPDQQLVEEHLPNLKVLRAKNRANQLQDDKYSELKGRLVGRYLSILFVYQNIDVFEELWSVEK